MVAYQMLLVGVFAHTTDTLETFVHTCLAFRVVGSCCSALW
jgi:hypothetical protein